MQDYENGVSQSSSFLPPTHHRVGDDANNNNHQLTFNETYQSGGDNTNTVDESEEGEIGYTTNNSIEGGDGGGADGADIEEQKHWIRRTFIFIEYPISTWFIMFAELCERFAFYGFKTILSLYLLNYLKFDQDASTSIVHAFVFFAYLTPIMGAFLADALIGKYWTIVLLCLVYCGGQTVISVTAIEGVTGTPPHWWGCMLGLFLVALGMGGIKPNVSSFGADQFREDQRELISSFFAIFYFSINIGSTVSSFVIPIIRSQYGYAVAFFVPLGLLIVATAIFTFGKCWYRTVKPSGLRNNPVLKFMKVVFVAVKEKFSTKNGRLSSPLSSDETSILVVPSENDIKKKEHQQQSVNISTTDDEIKDEHWIDAAIVKCSEKEVNDAKCVWRVCITLLPITVFWSLFDQHSSRFVFQAEMMNRRVGSYVFGSDQITTINPILVIGLVIVFDRFIYRAISKFYFLTPLRKIGIGMAIASMSFVCAAVVEVFVRMYPRQIHVAWQLPQYILLSVAEILVSVTGLEFAYSQSPKEMKSLLQSYYLLTVSMGNVIVVVVASIPMGTLKEFPLKQVYEFSFFALLMLVGLVFHLVMANMYRYRKIEKELSADSTSTTTTAAVVVDSSDGGGGDKEQQQYQ